MKRGRGRPTNREAKIQRLSDELEALELENAPKPPAWFYRVNSNEQAFVTRAMAKKKGRLFRSGWPDFLIQNGEDSYCVEVKAGDDGISPRQAAMFAALERGLLRVYIWNPARPEVLVPWRRYFDEARGVLKDNAA